MSATPRVLALVPDLCDFAALAESLVAAGIQTERTESLLGACLHQVSEPAGLVLCDADAVDWREVLLVLRRLKRSSPVVFLTRLADERLWLDMLEAGAFDLVAKPYRPCDLRWVAITALKKHVAVRASAA